MASKAFSFFLPSLSEVSALARIVAEITPLAQDQTNPVRPGYEILLNAVNRLIANDTPIANRLSELRRHFVESARNSE